MKNQLNILKIFLVCFFLSIVAQAQTGGDVLRFKARIGFDDKKERITAKHFSEDGTKLTLIGLKTIQIWDVPTAKLLKSYPHEIVELDKFFGTFYQLSPDGSKLITLDSFGRDGDKKADRVNAYVFDVSTGKRVAVLERPDYSVRFAFWSANGETLVTFSGLVYQKQTEISFWNGADLSHRKSFTIDGFTWHYLSPDGERLYVGNGGQIKVLGLPAGPSNGNAVRVYNTKTGAVEKELRADGADFDIDYSATRVSPGGRFIATPREKNIVVWDTAANAVQPIYELAPRDPKGKISLEGFSDDGKYLYAGQKKVEEFYELESGRLATDVPKHIELSRDSKHTVPNRVAIGTIHDEIYLKKKSVLQTRDGKYAVALTCGQTTVLDLTTNQNLYAIRGECSSVFKLFPLNPNVPDYAYSQDVYRLSPSGKLLINFRYDQFVARDLKTGTILQTIARKQDKNLMEVPKLNINWDIKGSFALTIAEDAKSILIWEINEN